jgi:hypothetical protein
LLTLGFAALFLFFQPASIPTAAAAGDTLSSFKEIFQNGLVPCGHKDSSVNGERPSDTCTISDIFVGIARVTNFLMGFAAVFVIYKFVNAGFGMVTSNGNPQSLQVAKDGMANAFWGMMLILIAYVLVLAVIYAILRINYAPGDLLTNPTKYITTPNATK